MPGNHALPAIKLRLSSAKAFEPPTSPELPHWLSFLLLWLVVPKINPTNSLKYSKSWFSSFLCPTEQQTENQSWQNKTKPYFYLVLNSYCFSFCLFFEVTAGESIGYLQCIAEGLLIAVMKAIQLQELNMRLLYKIHAFSSLGHFLNLAKRMIQWSL